MDNHRAPHGRDIFVVAEAIGTPNQAAHVFALFHMSLTP